MATIPIQKTINPITINKFLGLNLSNTGDTQIKLGESGNMNNFYITNDYKLKKIYGYKSFWNFEHPVNGMKSVVINKIHYLLISTNGKLYYFLSDELDNSDLFNFNVQHKLLDVDGSTNILNIGVNKILSIDSVYSVIENVEMLIDPEYYSVNLNTGIITVDQTVIDSIAADEGQLKVNYIKHIVPTEIGTIPNEECSFFTFDNKVYILCGKYMSWDGTTLKEVEGYVPLVYISTPPSGGGTPYEDINLLTGKKYATFNGDGTSTVYHLSETNIDSVYKIEVDGVELASTEYTTDLIHGTVTFNTAPSQNMDNVHIYWNKDNNTRHFIEKMKYGTIFGGNVDTRVFLYGNPDERNRIRYSGVELDAKNSKPSVEYFPTFYQLEAGPKNFAVTDLTRQYDRLLITTNKPEAYYLTLGTVQLDENNTTTSVQTFPLNEAHGNIAMGQGQVINNDPVTIENGSIIRWKATNVRDERNMQDISQKIKLDLIGYNLVNMKTLDYQAENQLWLALGNKIYIYNYYNDTYSRLIIADDVAQIEELDNVIYVATDQGKIVKFGEQYDDFDGTIINSNWEMNFYDFEIPYLRKTMKKLWVLMQPQAKASAKIGYISNRNESPVKKEIEYSLVLLDDVDFSDFSFQISSNPQPFRLKLKAKKFTNLKITIENAKRTDCTILALSLRVETGGESK